ncbi:Hypothetical protein ADU71_2035 [Pediococcus damnosus]|nr:Hypothetical protein ADU71_2035 [Pediococcus damnosus]
MTYFFSVLLELLELELLELELLELELEELELVEDFAALELDAAIELLLAVWLEALCAFDLLSLTESATFFKAFSADASAIFLLEAFAFFWRRQFEHRFVAG